MTLKTDLAELCSRVDVLDKAVQGLLTSEDTTITSGGRKVKWRRDYSIGETWDCWIAGLGEYTLRASELGSWSISLEGECIVSGRVSGSAMQSSAKNAKGLAQHMCEEHSRL